MTAYQDAKTQEWHSRLPAMLHKALTYWVIVASTRQGDRLRTSIVCDRVDAQVARLGHPPIAEAQTRQVLIRLRRDKMIEGWSKAPVRGLLGEIWWYATDTSWAGRDDPRWPLLYEKGSSAYRIPDPSWRTRSTREIETFPAVEVPALIAEEEKALGRSVVPTYFG